MWTVHRKVLSPNTLHFTLQNASNGHPLSTSEVIHAWQTNAVFRSFFSETLAQAPFRAFRWETPVLTPALLGRPFEFVLVEDRTLFTAPDCKPFETQFSPKKYAVVFPNVGGDAILVVPCPIQPDHTAYTHIANFVRHAPAAQIHVLWEQVASAVQQRLGLPVAGHVCIPGQPHAPLGPLWLSTAGGGVAWLHIRLDDRPKYYHHLPYTVASKH